MHRAGSTGERLVGKSIENTPGKLRQLVSTRRAQARDKRRRMRFRRARARSLGKAQRSRLPTFAVRRRRRRVGERQRASKLVVDEAGAGFRRCECPSGVGEHTRTCVSSICVGRAGVLYGLQEQLRAFRGRCA